MQAPASYIVRSYGLKEIVANNYCVNISPQEERKHYIKQADCQYFRLIRNITGVNSKFNPYVVFVDIDCHKDLSQIITTLVMDGIRIRGARYVLGERSASMVRQGTLSFVDESIAPELEKRITMGLDIGKTVLSKWQAYRGLVLSSCHCIEGYVPKMIVVPDYETVIPNQHVRFLCDERTTFKNENGEDVEWVQKGIDSGVKDITINAFDGAGIMHANVAKEIERRIGSNTEITTCIFRAPFIKGALHVMDYEAFLEERGVEYIKDIWGKWHSIHDEMIILTEGMYKGIKYFRQHGDARDWDRYWDAFKKYGHCIAIARANFTKDEETVYTRSNYQVLQTLDLPYDKFRTLADKSIEWVNRIIDGDELYTKCFLGLVDGKCKALNAYVAAIAKNDAMMKEPTVRKYMISLVSKYLDEMKAGKLYIKSCFKFAAPDMIAMMEHIGGLPVKGILAADEFWTNGKWMDYKGEYLITRNPHICKSENVILKASENPEMDRWCGHLSNVCVVNIKSLTPQRLNGMDFDGDLVLVNDNATMLEGVDRDAQIVIDAEDKITAIAEADIVQNRIACILRTTKSMIGEYSNYASAYHNRLPTTKEQKDKYAKYVDIISVITGKSIDYAKTGVLYSMPRNISKYGRPLPYFMKYRSPYYARQTLSRAPSNMNKLCWDIEHWERGVKFKRNTGFDYRIMLNEDLIYDDETFDAVHELFLRFCKETTAASRYQSVVRKYENKAVRKQFTRSEAAEYMADWDVIYEKYKAEAKKICPDQCILANIAVVLCYEYYKNKGMKFPWIVAGDGLVKNIRVADVVKMPMQDADGRCEYLGKRYSLLEVRDELEMPDELDELEFDFDGVVD